MELKKAQRKQAKVKLALQGAGAGKILLESGRTDWTKIAVIDTENQSADL